LVVGLTRVPEARPRLRTDAFKYARTRLCTNAFKGEEEIGLAHCHGQSPSWLESIEAKERQAKLEEYGVGGGAAG
jgi:hypothetical protein